MGNHIRNLTYYSHHPGVSGSLTIHNASDEYIEAVTWAYENALPVPVPIGLPTGIDRVFVTHFRVDSTGRIDATVFGGPLTFLEGPKTLEIEFHAGP